MKSGFVNIIGRPNVGKSTLMNALIGEKLSIVTKKVQTTRHRILGILNGDGYQIVFSDTPGIIAEPKYMLHEVMMKYVNSALEDADVVLYMVDVTDKMEEASATLQKILKTGKPVFLVINKIDLREQEQAVDLIQKWSEFIAPQNIIPISAANAFNIEKIMQVSLDYLPEGEPFFPEEQLTDKSERFLAAEVIREKIFIHFKQEIPYSTTVVITAFNESETLVRISGEIIVSRESQKPILIGKGGESLKRVGTLARKELEETYGKKVFLELFVKVREDWREKKNFLNQFGYDA